MKKTLNFLLISSMMIFMLGCGEDESGESTTVSSSAVDQGWHFQGRDCLACHNVDLQEPEHLLFGGTLYKEQGVSNQDDLNNVCGGDFVINYLDNNFNPVYSSEDYKDSSSKGYKGKGNLFILQRKLRLLTAGTYHVQITDKNGNLMALSGYNHFFSSGDYDINNPAANDNRVSCNACHVNGGAQPPLFVNFTANNKLCQ